jgi:hypothetical protein
MPSASRSLAALAALAAVTAAQRASAHCMVGPRTIAMTLAIETPCVVDDFMPMVMGTKNADYTRELDVQMQWSKRITADFGVTLAGAFTRMWMPDNLAIMPMDMHELHMPMPAMDMSMGGADMGMHHMPPMLMWMPMYMRPMEMTGWQNLRTTFKYQLVTDKRSEFVLSAGLLVDWGGTGDRQSGAPRYTTLNPMLFFGKGFGDLPESLAFARPFAITGQFGIRLPTWSRTLSISDTGMSPVAANMTGMWNMIMDMSCLPMSSPFTFDTPMNMRSVNSCRHAPTFVYGASLQYDFSYGGKGEAGLLKGLIPIVEAQFRTPTSGTSSTSWPPFTGVIVYPSVQGFNTAATSAVTVGTINPGLIYMHDAWQIGAEAIVPINRQSGKGLGWMVSLDFYLHKIFPDTLGRPLFGEDPHADHDHGHEGHDREGHDHDDHAGHDHDHDDRAHGEGHSHDHGAREGAHARNGRQPRVSRASSGNEHAGHSH